MTAPLADRRLSPRPILPAGRGRRGLVLVAAGAACGLALAAAVGAGWGGVLLGAVDLGARWAGYTAALLAAGGVLFTWLVLGDDGDTHERAVLGWVVQAAAGAGTLAALAGFAMHTLAISGRGPEGLLDQHGVAHAGMDAHGTAAVVTSLGLVYIAYAARRLEEPGRLLVGVGGVVFVLGAMLLTGHTASSEPRLLVVTAGFAHTLAAATWLGGLVLLATSLRLRRATGDAAGAARLVARFSTLAGAALGLLTVAGTALAWSELSGPGALLSTPFGRALLVKVGIVGLVALVAGHNHRTLVPAVVRGERAPWPLLARTVRWEIVGILAVLAVTSLLVGLDPGHGA